MTDEVAEDAEKPLAGLKWVGNSLLDRSSWDIADQVRRHGGAYQIGAPAAMPRHTAEALTAMGWWGFIGL